ncbi:glycosyl hydrolase [Parvularcula marina]|uniref:Glycosyl hydrolase n=2 Tax=Parvularcula marina TaxID=2292771 RepID=A0A371RLH4_9PROT|nr:glycosyl hydrolase [Parvularcula marina]
MRTLLRLLSVIFVLGTAASAQNDPMVFWSEKPREGGNSFNETPPDHEYFQALANYGGEWVRLSYSKWDGQERDFLMGSADGYEQLVEDDLAILIKTLDLADQAGIKVVLTPLGLPGSRWTQNNDGKIDDRIYQDKAYWEQSAAFWQDLVIAIDGHPAIVAYNLVNEPTPERPAGLESSMTEEQIAEWHEVQRGTARDLFALTSYLVAAIREVDEATPIMVDGGFYGSANGFNHWPSGIDDDRVLYDFHMYEPWAATSNSNLKRDKPLVYPGTMEISGRTEHWDPDRIKAIIQQPLDWAEEHNIPANRIVMGEFGCMRRLEWCPDYLEDVLTAAEKLGYHWAFYSFREYSWDGMDYELGGEKVRWTFWDSPEAQKAYPRGPTPQFEPIQKRLQQNLDGQ